MIVVPKVTMGGSSSKTEIENNDIKGDENKNENVGFLQITFEHVSGSFMTLFLIGLIIFIFLVVRWFRKRGRRSQDRHRKLDAEANWNLRDPPGRPHRLTMERDSRVDMQDLPRLFVVSNATETSQSAQKWSPSQERLKSKTSPF